MDEKIAGYCFGERAGWAAVLRELRQEGAEIEPSGEEEEEHTAEYPITGG